MSIVVEGNSIFSNGKKISNFTLEKIADGLYLMNNGVHKRTVQIEYRHLHHFKCRTVEQGYFVFQGNTKEMNEILNSLDALGFQKSNNKFHFQDKVVG